METGTGSEKWQESTYFSCPIIGVKGGAFRGGVLVIQEAMVHQVYNLEHFAQGKERQPREVAHCVIQKAVARRDSIVGRVMHRSELQQHHFCVGGVSMHERSAPGHIESTYRGVEGNRLPQNMLKRRIR